MANSLVFFGATWVVGIPVFSLAMLAPRFDLIPYGACIRRRVLAGQHSDGQLVLVLSDHRDGATEDWASRAVGPNAKLVYANPDDLVACLAQHEERLRAMQGLAGDAIEGDSADVVEDISLARIHDDTSPVVKLVNSTLYDALKLQASD